MTMEVAAIVGMALVVLWAMGALGLAFWSAHHEQARRKDALPSH